MDTLKYISHVNPNAKRANVYCNPQDMFWAFAMGERGQVPDAQRNFNIQGSGDPATTAGMIGLHTDRSANTISRNLQGAFQ